jgi:hypothetical protein
VEVLAVEIVPKVEIDAVLEQALSEVLVPLGLAAVSPRRWVHTQAGSARRLLEVRAMKGAALQLWWGFSLDYVPHISGGKLRWHRTVKSAMLDVMPEIESLAVDPNLSVLFGKRRFIADLQRVIPHTLAHAEVAWGRGESLQGIADLLSDFRARKSSGPGFYNFVQLPLALAFTLARLGRWEEGESELDSVLQSEPYSTVADPLRQAFRRTGDAERAVIPETAQPTP